MYKLYSALFSKYKYHALGATLATPLVAIAQGAYLLLDYRLRHSHAPRPHVPCRGLVLVDGSNNNNNNANGSNVVTSQSSPLRVLVIGDSLAAGVGMRDASTPALPEAMAQTLSRAMNGRLVEWTCIGSPGLSSGEIVAQIVDLENAPSAIWREWHKQRRHAVRRAKERLDAAKKGAEEWWDIHKHPVHVDPATVPNPVVRWWTRFTKGFARDVKNIKKIVIEPPQLDDMEKETTANRQLNNRLTKLSRQQTLATDIAGQFDIAIVLTGLNDIKDSFLPFLMSHQRRKRLAEMNTQTGEDGLIGELLRIIDALKSRMHIPSSADTTNKPTTNCETIKSQAHCSNVVLDKPSGTSETGRNDYALVVFPALPIEITTLCHTFPLAWFLSPIMKKMDQNKKVISEMLPGLVLFVDTPQTADVIDAEIRHGSDCSKERVLLTITDASLTAQNKIKGLMADYYSSSVHVMDNDESLYTVQDDAVVTWSELRYDRKPTHVGASLLSADGVHPNDEGYRFWGRYIAHDILLHLAENNKKLNREAC